MENLVLFHIGSVNPCKIRRWVERTDKLECKSFKNVSILVKFGDGLKDSVRLTQLYNFLSVNPCKIRRWVERIDDYLHHKTLTSVNPCKIRRWVESPVPVTVAPSLDVCQSL